MRFIFLAWLVKGQGQKNPSLSRELLTDTLQVSNPQEGPQHHPAIMVAMIEVWRDELYWKLHGEKDWEVVPGHQKSNSRFPQPKPPKAPQQTTERCQDVKGVGEVWFENMSFYFFITMMLLRWSVTKTEPLYNWCRDDRCRAESHTHTGFKVLLALTMRKGEKPTRSQHRNRWRSYACGASLYWVNGAANLVLFELWRK